ncbi:hypothetical protein L2E82_44331 [Cichorium intybus]|uniref:Uncharacterized protein n=1 Tax=Cichorium intybus TaxID=13427 RepID=A0ACB8ZUJ7_CICIN|nr:hypothetical protein L2E82_44331 [Cichorium intybus]
MASQSIPDSDIFLVHSDTDEESLHEAGCSRPGCCYWMPCMQSHRPPGDLRWNWWEPITENGKADGRRWWSKGLMAFKKIREWSELVAGPKWKTFIRQFQKKRSKQSKFQYDPVSYSLNFDEGQAHTEDNDLCFRDFSSRYASIPISTKSYSIDLGKDELSFA